MEYYPAIHDLIVRPETADELSERMRKNNEIVAERRRINLLKEVGVIKSDDQIPENSRLLLEQELNDVMPTDILKKHGIAFIFRYFLAFLKFIFLV
jgi:hypothetical protein